MLQERNYWLAWSQVEGVGPILLDRIAQQFESLAAAWNADRTLLQAIDGIGEISISKIISSRAKIDPNNLAIKHSIDNPHWWTRGDVEYPRLLSEIPSAPAVLYYRGQVLPAENRGNLPTIGIVGTRKPSDYGNRWTQKISAMLARKGFTIVSGLAQGIDTAAHTACLEAGGRTIAVVGTGVDIVYPAPNQGLAADIQQQGLIVSEYPAGTPPDRSHFPARNRIIAGLSRVTIVIEAPLKSGALITAHQANDFGRDVYVLPGSLDNVNSAGGLGLLSRGAQPILGLDHLLELLATIPALGTPQQLQLFPTSDPVTATDREDPVATPMPPNLTPDFQTVWTCVTTEPSGFDEIVMRSQLPAANVSSILLQLELLGSIVQLPGMRYQK
jgi:DNA processing protein